MLGDPALLVMAAFMGGSGIGSVLLMTRAREKGVRPPWIALLLASFALFEPLYCLYLLNTQSVEFTTLPVLAFTYCLLAGPMCAIGAFGVVYSRRR